MDIENLIDNAWENGELEEEECDNLYHELNDITANLRRILIQIIVRLRLKMGLIK
jgi:hypothetical protein